MMNNFKEVELVFENISDMVFFIREANSEDYEITFSNKVFKQILNASKFDYTDIKMYNVFSPQNCNLILSTIKKINTRQKTAITELSLVVDKKIKYFEATIKLVNTEQLNKYFLISCHDITNRKNYEEQIRRIQCEAEESSKLKDSLLLNINHEFRTPLHGILGISEMLIEESNDDQQKELLRRITNSGRRLLNTLVSIIELSRLESLERKVYSTKVSLTDVINSVIDKYRLEAEHKGLTLSSEIPNVTLTAHVDESFLRLVVTNLVDNAIKFTNRGFVKVILKKESKEGSNFALIQVFDTGIGISKNNLDKIFNAFIQESDGVGRSHEGVGVGLTLVRQMTGMMGGEVTVESEKNIGSKFTISFPVSNDENVPNKTFQTAPYSQLKNNNLFIPSILIVEDNEINSMLTKTFLRNKYTVDVTDNAAHALELIEKNDYTVILLDINLGSGMNGVDLLNEIRNNYHYTDTPIIAMTGYAFNADKEDFLSNGFTNYIAKPFSKQQLLSLMEETLSVPV
ncbi:MAG: ATP-binding protein [Melioribacteraceae bacterium]